MVPVQRRGDPASPTAAPAAYVVANVAAHRMRVLRQGAGLLTAAEIARARGILRAHRKLDYVYGRIVLRFLAARWLGVAWSRVEASAGPGPVALSVAGRPVFCSLSHRGTHFAAVFSEQSRVGIDVERVRPGAAEAVRAFLRPWRESAIRWRDAEAIARWCELEAIGKALGTGLGASAMQVRFRAAGPARFGVHWRAFSLGGDACGAVSWVTGGQAKAASAPDVVYIDSDQFCGAFPRQSPGRSGRIIMEPITIRQPDDWHLHLRDDAVMAAVVPWTARTFARAIVMPNLRSPVTTVEQARSYRARILAALPAGMRFEPLMTLYLTGATPADEIGRARDSGFVHGVKLYPARATTNSQFGVRSIADCTAVLEAMQRADLPLLVHGEVARPDADVFDRERIFLDEVLIPLRRDFPELRVVLEHITTREAVEIVREAPGRIAATITAHHLAYNRNAMFVGADGSAGMHPHYYCLPVLKREDHRRALVEAAVSGNPRFFLGTDSAPHPRQDKESACGCAGCFTAPFALPLYATVFEQAGALDRLEAFASEFGPDFYGLPRNEGTVRLVRGSPDEIPPVVAGDLEFTALGRDACRWRMTAAA